MKRITSLFIGILVMTSVIAQAAIYREVSPSGHVTFSDQNPAGYQPPSTEVNKRTPADRRAAINKNKWLSPNVYDKKTAKPEDLYDLTGSFDDAILDNWLSSYWDCSNHFERVDLKYNNVLYFFSQHSPLVIPIIEQQNKSFRLFYSSQFDFQLDTKKQVLLKKTNKEKSKVMYICDEQVVPQHYRDGYATYRVNQDFLSGHSQGENIAIKDGARFLEQECRRTYQAKEYELARSTCGLAAANEKNVIAKYYLGMLYRYNQGGEIDLEASFKNISDAANAGFSPAFGWLAWHYNFGKSVKKDYREALRWYVAAVDSGEFNLAESVAGFYMYGKGVEVDYKQAAAWLLIAARAGDSHAQNKIGCMFANGVGVRQDYQLAHHWILKSSRQNNPKAIYNLAVLYDAGKIVKNGKGYASELYRKAAKYGLRKSTDITDKLDRVMIQ